VDLPRREVAPENAILVLNGEPLGLEDFDDDFRLMALHYSAVSEGDMRRMKRLLSERVIDQRLLCQEARRRGVRVTRREFERALKDASRDVPDDFTLLLRKQGVTVEVWKRGILMKLIVDKLTEREVFRKVEITPREVAEYYWSHLAEWRSPASVRARHLVVRNLPDLASAKRRLAAGEDFGKVAADLSAGPSKAEGGLWDWMPVAHLPALYVKALAGLAPGGVSGLYRDGFGYHMFQLVDRRPERMRALSEVEQAIHARLLGEEQDYRFDQWLTALKERAVIRVNREMETLIGETPEVPREKNHRSDRLLRRPGDRRP
jgi:peptidyl-prolyl cis-trans isomerase C/foldase protein PrsA